MEKANSSLSQRVIFWSVLGPFILLTTLAISMIKATQTVPAITLAALVGIPMCYRWKNRGLIASMALLGVLLLMSFTTLPSQQRFWQVGFSMAMALSFLVTSLSFEEVEEILENILSESKSRLDNLWRLDEKLKKIQERWQTDREDYSVRLKLMAEEAEEQKALLVKYEKTLELSREELEKEKLHQQKLLHDLLAEKRRIELLEKEKRNLTEESDGLKSSYATQQGEVTAVSSEKMERLTNELEELRDQLAAQSRQQAEAEAMLEERDAMIREREAKIEEQQEKIHSFAELEKIYAEFQENDTLKSRHERLLEALADLEERYDALKRENEHLVAEVTNRTGAEGGSVEGVEELQKTLQEAIAKYEEQNRELRKLMGLHKQLEEQFKEKSDVLNQTRVELFQSEGQIVDLKNAIEDIKKSDLDAHHKELERMVITLEQQRKDHEKEIVDLNNLVTMLFEEISQKTPVCR